MTEEERHRAPAPWVVVACLAAGVAVTWFVGALPGLLVLVLVLAGAAVARLVGRGRRPVGIAVRSTWQDAAILLALAVTIAVLATTPGVAEDDEGGAPRSGGAQERVSSSTSTTSTSSVDSSSSSS